MQDTQRQGFTQRVVEVFLTGNLSPLLLLLSLVAGVVALLATPREEDPQIVVPVADVVVDAPGSSALEVERQVTIPLERIVRAIDGVENVYSTSRRGSSVVTVRFFVGEDPEESLVKLQAMLQRSEDQLPPQVRSWRIAPVAIDDVPVFAATLHSTTLDDHDLQRIAAEMLARLQQVEDAGPATLHGGRSREVSVTLDATALAARNLGFEAVLAALDASSISRTAGSAPRNDLQVTVEAAPAAPDAHALRGLVIGVADGQPVQLGEVARVEDRPSEPAALVFQHGGAARGAAEGAPQAAVTIAVAKRKGSNAVAVTHALRERLGELQREMLPPEVSVTVMRDSGETADEKVLELLEGLAVAIAIVVVLVTMMLGWREALVVALAVPVTFGLTLLVNLLFGYTINRVTLFALILALGLVVDDPIVDVENIHRHLQRKGVDALRAVVDAVNEVRPPVITATLAVILSFLPLFFITGMMGPYMQPMALNVPVSMLMSLLVAFTLTPWMAYLALRGGAGAAGEAGHDAAHPLVQRAYAALVRPLLRSRRVRWLTFGCTTVLFACALSLAVLREVPLKMLPYDNKTELQVLLDLDEGTTLERSAALGMQCAEVVRRLPEVTDVTSYAGVASPMDFNGMVRKYHQRKGPELAELRVQLLPKKERRHQSHEVALRIRELLAPLATASGASLRVVELPPGPPVLATVVAEVRAPADATPAELDASARLVADRLRAEPGVVDVETSVEAAPVELRFEIDQVKAALNGIDSTHVARALATAVGGIVATHLHEARELTATPVVLRIQPWQRADATYLGELRVQGRGGVPVSLAEVGRFSLHPREGTIHRKDLERVAYVMAEAAGRPPAEIVLDVQADLGAAGGKSTSGAPRALEDRSLAYLGGGIPWQLPLGTTVGWRGEGEWKITLDAFRDLGLAFLAACLGIYILLVHETGSYVLPLVLMLSIPFTILGILPGFWLLNLWLDVPVAGVGNPVFFTATAMIGMIALAGIAVRNSIILVDFIHGAERHGATLEDAILLSGAVRLRPIVLTAGAAILASVPITLDPIFSGLAWALVFGLVVSSAFTLVLVPVVYAGLRARRAPGA